MWAPAEDLTEPDDRMVRLAGAARATRDGHELRMVHGEDRRDVR
jgi:hypothetical protein